MHGRATPTTSARTTRGGLERKLARTESGGGVVEHGRRLHDGGTHGCGGGLVSAAVHLHLRRADHGLFAGARWSEGHRRRLRPASYLLYIAARCEGRKERWIPEAREAVQRSRTAGEHQPLPGQWAVYNKEGEGLRAAAAVCRYTNASSHQVSCVIRSVFFLLIKNVFLS